ncbi:MAG: HlyD family efflux transporter periplasmic adaptor subunit [Janthinobacterium sp.]|jgi:RND family efflux transporter MFP subunit
MLNFIKKPVGIVSIIVIVGIVFVAIFATGSNGSDVIDTATAVIGNVVQEVRLSGTVKPAKSVDLAFEKSGTVSRVYAKVGDKVFAGQSILSLESSEASAQLGQAEADLKVQEAKLAELQRGTRSETINIQETKVAGAVSALEDSRSNLSDKISEAYTKADEAVRSSVDQFFTNPRSANPQISFGVTNVQVEIDVETQRHLIEDLLTGWYDKLSAKPGEDLAVAKNRASANLSLVKTFLDKVWSALNSASTDPNISTSDIIGWKSDVFVAQTNVNTAIANITAGAEKLKSAETDLAVAKSQLNLDLAGTASEQISGQLAQVDKARANRDYYRAQLYKNIIRSPIDAVVTKQDGEVGEIAPANKVLVSLNSMANYEIESNVAEAEIAKIKVGNTATAVLDAYGSETVFNVNVTQIDPAETLIDGIATYKVKFQFNSVDERIRSGMTASITLTADKKENVIVLPSRAIDMKDSNKIVFLKVADKSVETIVKLGLRGSNGDVEIIEGIKVGDVVVVPLK